MDRPSFQPSLAMLLLFIASMCFAQKKESRPNIIYMMADDLGYADLSCFGRKDYQTPNLDRLASQGVKLMNAYATAPVCTPTRVAFMTGRYPARTEVGLHEPLDWSTGDSLLGLSPRIPSIASLLKEAGYSTYLVGKWHLGFKPAFSPIKNGFDYFFGFHSGAIDYISHTSPQGMNDLFEGDQPVTKEGYMTDILMDKAIELISQPHDRPFFLSLMFSAPHWPWQAPGDKPYPEGQRWPSGGSPAIYAAMVKSLDHAVGMILQSIDDHQLAANTVVIFTSDNGGERFSDMGMYKGKKMELWEGGIREPAMVRWPGHIQANTLSQQVTTTMDWTASILSLAGARAKSSYPLDGMDIMPILTGKKGEIPRTMYWRISQRNQQKAMRQGAWKYLQDEKGKEYLFNLEADPTEANNLMDKEALVFARLKKLYGNWEKTVLRPLPPIK